MDCVKKFLGSLLLPLVLMGCDAPPPQGEEKKTLIMGTAADNPPFEFYQTTGSTSRIAGFDVDLANRIGEYLGVEVEIKDMDFASLVPALSSGRIDFAMAALTPTPERERNLDFSDPYYSVSNVLISLKDADFMEEGAFKGRKIAAQLGSTQEQFANAWKGDKPGLEIVPLNKLGDMVQEVLSGRLDGVIIEETPGRAYVEKHPFELKFTKLQDKGGAFAIGFEKGSPLRKKINKALAHLKEIGYVEELEKRWLIQE